MNELLAEKNTLLPMKNNITHEPALMKEPEFVPEKKVDNTMVRGNEKDLHRLYV